MHSPRIAVALVTTHYEATQSEFYSQLSGMGMDFYTVVDSMERVETPANHNVIQIEDQLCLDRGIARMNPTNPKASQVCAWEKALYFFTQLRRDYDYIWFVEYDVFTPNVEIFSTLNEKYPDADCLARRTFTIKDSRFEPWPDARFTPRHLLPQPWLRAMTCVSRMSLDLLDRTVEFVSSYSADEVEYAPIEFIFHNIASRDGLKIVEAPEFENVVFKNAQKFAFFHKESDWSPEEIHSGLFYHPVKKYEDQATLRESYPHVSESQRRAFYRAKRINFLASYVAHAPIFYIRLVRRYAGTIAVMTKWKAKTPRK